MANRFDRAADAQFINTYAPIPFQELAQAAQMRQNTYDQNSARVDAAIAAADDLLAIPNSADARRADEIRASLSKVSDEFAGQDLSDPEIYRSLKKKIRQIASPGEVKSIQQSYAGWQNYKKLENQMKAKGQAVYNPYDFTGYDSFNTGVFTDTPTMDLGAQAEDAINKFMSKPELKYREVELDSGRVGIEHYRDVDEINNLINSESGE
ncbi:MAG TPA: hypothetical protein VJ907_06755, partial [Halanaerobiales bacterium]|nr:hypothetical protein [Halanaerobiales bacterium]